MYVAKVVGMVANPDEFGDPITATIVMVMGNNLGDESDEEEEA